MMNSLTTGHFRDMVSHDDLLCSFFEGSIRPTTNERNSDMTRKVKKLVEEAQSIVLANKNAENFFWFDGYISALLDLDLISADRGNDLIGEMMDVCKLVPISKE